MSHLTQRIVALERQAGQRRGATRCPDCRDWPRKHLLVTEVAWDGTVKRADVMDQPDECSACGWQPKIVRLEIQEVKDWDRVGHHGLD